MQLLLILVSVALIAFPQQSQTNNREDPDLLVLKFSWSKQRQNTDLIHSAGDPGPAMNEPVSISLAPPRNEPAEIRNRRDMQQRRAEMAASEKNAANSTTRSADSYFLRLEVKNAGSNIVKSFVWEYEPSTAPSDYEPRQYLCTMKAKPNESKAFELTSPFAPIKVISAQSKADQSQGGKVVINRIEYADGSIWKRTGWSILIPPETTQKMGNGKCIGF